MKNFVQSKITINFHLNCELCKAWCALAVIQSPAQSFMLVFHSLNSPDIRGISLWVLPKSYWTTTSLPYGSSWSPHRSQSTQLLTCLLRLRSIRNMIVIIQPCSLHFWRLFTSLYCKWGKFPPEGRNF